MHIKIDIKSAVLGLVAGVVTMLAVGATTSTPPGRYQIAGAPPLFLLVDTTSGQVWTANFSSTAKSTDENFFGAK